MKTKKELLLYWESLIADFVEEIPSTTVYDIDCLELLKQYVDMRFDEIVHHIEYEIEPRFPNRLD